MTPIYSAKTMTQPYPSRLIYFKSITVMYTNSFLFSIYMQNIKPN